MIALDSSTRLFKIATLGCRTNQYESQAYRDQLIKMGWSEADDNQPADLCIVNTCTVTESADISSRQQIKQLAKKNPEAKIYVTGCAAEKNPQSLKTLPQVEEVVPNLKKESLIPMIFQDQDVPEFKIERFEAHTRAFIKVQDGCNSYCSYCIIPFVRGRSRSKKMEEIILEAQGLIQNGYQEIVLTGINIGDFDGGVADGEVQPRLADLVTAIDQLPGLQRLRVSSIDPDEVDDRLLKAIVEGKNTCHSMHIVLQSGSNTVLKRMNRKYTKQQFYDAINRLKEQHADFTFTTDVIVGFPGETDAEFEETLHAIRQVRFAKVHMFPYSLRPGTRAARLPNPVSQQVIAERKDQVLRLAEQVAFELREGYVGQVMPVLLESKERLSDAYTGHTDNFLEVIVSGRNLLENTIYPVRMVSNSAKGLIGEVVV